MLNLYMWSFIRPDPLLVHLPLLRDLPRDISEKIKIFSGLKGIWSNKRPDIRSQL